MSLALLVLLGLVVFIILAYNSLARQGRERDGVLAPQLEWIWLQQQRIVRRRIGRWWGRGMVRAGACRLPHRRDRSMTLA
jgi:hypothetical protein